MLDNIVIGQVHQVHAVLIPEGGSPGGIGPDVVAVNLVPVCPEIRKEDTSLSVSRDDVAHPAGKIVQRCGTDNIFTCPVPDEDAFPVGQSSGAGTVGPDVVAKYPVMGGTPSRDLYPRVRIPGDDVPVMSGITSDGIG